MTIIQQRFIKQVLEQSIHIGEASQDSQHICMEFYSPGERCTSSTGSNALILSFFEFSLIILSSNQGLAL